MPLRGSHPNCIVLGNKFLHMNLGRWDQIQPMV
jgi:hypothetical protein